MTSGRPRVDLRSRPLVRPKEFAVERGSAGALACFLASQFFDIVKSECVRSSGSVPQGAGVRSSRMMFPRFSASVHQVRGGGVVHR